MLVKDRHFQRKPKEADMDMTVMTRLRLIAGFSA